MKILIVDDDDACIQSLADMLENEHEIHAAHNGEEGLAMFETAHYDLVVTDYNMPKLNGTQLLRAIHERAPEMRVIMLTGFADVENAIESVNAGAYAFFRKPLDVKDFLGTVTDIQKEMDGQEKDKSSHARMVMEYARLKQAYEALKHLLDKQMREAKEQGHA